CSTAASARSAASYPPIAASSRRWSTIASRTGRGINPAPALLKWSTFSHPDVSRRARSRSNVTDELPRSHVPGPAQRATSIVAHSLGGQGGFGPGRAQIQRDRVASWPPVRPQERQALAGRRQVEPNLDEVETGRRAGRNRHRVVVVHYLSRLPAARRSVAG